MHPSPPLAALGALLLATSSSAQLGSSYCSPNANSTGFPATLSAAGFSTAPWDHLTLVCSGLPPHSAAYFICGQNQGYTANSGGSAGNLCLTSPIGRLVGGAIGNSGSSGVVQALADLDAMPQPMGAVAVLAGDTWNFQCWYRDAVGGQATSNFSDGLEVTFTGGPGLLPDLVAISPGTFPMGSDEAPSFPYGVRLIERPSHPVTITYPFWICAHEVTQAEYVALMGSNPSFTIGPDHPVDTVSWNDARAYAAALTAQQAALGAVPAGYEYRIPTEAEWEYAARAGTATEYHTGPELLCTDAQIRSSAFSGLICGSAGSLPVGSFPPNAFGLYDIHGNVEEWVLDSLSPYPTGPVTDPFVTGGFTKITRGGGWNAPSSTCRSSSRGEAFFGPATVGIGFGIRVVLAPILVP